MGTFGSKSSIVKLNAITKNIYKEHKNSYILSEDVEVKTRIGDYNTKFNFKNNEIKALVDLNKHLYRFDNGVFTNVWLNPYVEAKFSRNLEDQTYSIGFLKNVDANLL